MGILSPQWSVLPKGLAMAGVSHAGDPLQETLSRALFSQGRDFFFSRLVLYYYYLLLHQRPEVGGGGGGLKSVFQDFPTCGLKKLRERLPGPPKAT